MKVFLIILAVLAAAVIISAIAAGPQLRDALASLAPDPPTTEVRAEPAAPGKLVETVQAPGGIEPHTDVRVAAEVSARIIELPFREGDEIHQGDIVCKLDDKDLRAALASAKALRDAEQFRLRSDQARLEGLVTNVEFARKELERIQTLYETGDVSQRELDNALESVENLETTIETTHHSISVAESSLAAVVADIDRAQDSLDNTVIVAPMDGVITMLNVEVGEVVTGSGYNPGTVIMTIADLSRMIMNAEVAESDIAKVTVGQKSKIHINAYPEEVFTGTVRQIALQRALTPNGVGYFKTEIEIDLQGRRIYSGLIANTDIEIATHEGLVVPYQAIVVRDVESLPEDARSNPLVDTTKRKVSVVYRIVDDKAVCTPVKPGASDLTHRIVLEGLAEGESIITGPYKVLESIKHDEAVRLEGAEEDGGGGTEAAAEAQDADTPGAGEAEDEAGDDGPLARPAEDAAPPDQPETTPAKPGDATPAQTEADPREDDSDT